MVVKLEVSAVDNWLLVVGDATVGVPVVVVSGDLSRVVKATVATPMTITVNSPPSRLSVR